MVENRGREIERGYTSTVKMVQEAFPSLWKVSPASVAHRERQTGQKKRDLLIDILKLKQTMKHVD